MSAKAVVVSYVSWCSLLEGVDNCLKDYDGQFFSERDALRLEAAAREVRAKLSESKGAGGA